MGLLDWLTGQPKFNRFEDSFAMTRANLWAKLQIAIAQQQNEGRRVWIVTHFAETFVEIQNLLADWQFEYQICDQEITPLSALALTRDPSGSVLLILADLLTLADAVPTNFDDSTAISIIVVERHPLVDNDQKLEKFAKRLSCPVRFGYYLAIDDVVISRAVSETTIQILRQLGMKDHELITSNMITRRLEKVLARERIHFTQNQRADSATEWYRLNQNDTN